MIFQTAYEIMTCDDEYLLFKRITENHLEAARGPVPTLGTEDRGRGRGKFGAQTECKSLRTKPHDGAAMSPSDLTNSL